MQIKSYKDMLQESGYLYWKTVGVSMRPLIREGKDTVLIKRLPMRPLQKYDVVLFRRPNVVGRGEYVLHRILKVNSDNTYFIVGDNCDSGEIVLQENIFGILDTVVRGGKKITADHLGYRLYVHLWCDLYPIRCFLLRYGNFPRRMAGRILRKLKLRT